MKILLIDMQLSKRKETIFASLSSRKMRDKHNLFLAEGEKCALDTLGAFPLAGIVATKEWLERNLHNINITDDKIFEASPIQISRISSLVTPPEMLAVFEIPTSEDLIGRLNVGNLYLMLDGIQDPGNLGTIIRLCDWFGVETIFASKDTVDVFNPKVVQSTMGSLKRVKVVYTDLKEIISNNPEIPVYGTFLEGKNIFKTALTKGGLVVMGNEGNGISDTLKGLIENKLLIPPYNQESHPESLNVATATAITLACFRNN